MVAFSEFREVRINVKSDLVEGGIEIFAKVGGEGPGLLLLHGYPQTHQYVPLFELNIIAPLAIHYPHIFCLCSYENGSADLAVSGDTSPDPFLSGTPSSARIYEVSHTLLLIRI